MKYASWTVYINLLCSNLVCVLQSMYYQAAFPGKTGATWSPWAFPCSDLCHNPACPYEAPGRPIGKIIKPVHVWGPRAFIWLFESLSWKQSHESSGNVLQNSRNLNFDLFWCYLGLKRAPTCGSWFTYSRKYIGYACTPSFMKMTKIFHKKCFGEYCCSQKAEYPQDWIEI